MARKDRSRAPAHDVRGERELYENFTLRLPRAASDRMQRFKDMHRISLGELFVFLMNVAKVNKDGSNRLMIDYSRFRRDPSDDGERGAADPHSMRMPLTESTRLRRFKDSHRLSMGELLVFLMDEAGIAPDGDTLVWIDYENLTIRQQA